jgi:hypothetical protein
MTDDELIDFLNIRDEQQRDKILAGITPEQRATYERIREVCFDIDLWEAGIGPRPQGVILCHDPYRDRGLSSI